MAPTFASARRHPEPVSPDWGEIHALLNAIRAPSRDDILAVVQGICGDGLGQATAERITDAVLGLVQGGPRSAG